MALDLERLATIPAMGGDKAACSLYLCACGVTEGAVVECGAWLGACTLPIACGLRDCQSMADLVVYDRWRATSSEVEKAAAHGVKLQPGQDILPLFMEYAGKIYQWTRPVQGDTMDATWDPARKIYLYVDDCNKRPEAFHHAMATFRPAFVPGSTYLYLMDYDYWEKHSGALRKALQCQRDYIESWPQQFRELMKLHGTGGRVFLYC